MSHLCTMLNFIIKFVFLFTHAGLLTSFFNFFRTIVELFALHRWKHIINHVNFFLRINASRGNLWYYSITTA
jgi:hypothetical protein